MDDLFTEIAANDKKIKRLLYPESQYGGADIIVNALQQNKDNMKRLFDMLVECIKEQKEEINGLKDKDEGKNKRIKRNKDTLKKQEKENEELKKQQKQEIDKLKKQQKQEIDNLKKQQSKSQKQNVKTTSSESQTNTDTKPKSVQTKPSVSNNQTQTEKNDLEETVAQQKQKIADLLSKLEFEKKNQQTQLAWQRRPMMVGHYVVPLIQYHKEKKKKKKKKKKMTYIEPMLGGHVPTESDLLSRVSNLLDNKIPYLTRAVKYLSMIEGGGDVSEELENARQKVAAKLLERVFTKTNDS
jgi:myosin heavy subunit